MVSGFFPIIVTRNMSSALGFYRDLLGGRVTFEFPGPDGEPAYAGVEIGSGHLGIGLDPDAMGVPSDRFSLWAYVDDCDAAVGRLRAAGVTVVEEPADQPWGERVARVLDPDGNLVLIGQAVSDRASGG